MPRPRKLRTVGFLPPSTFYKPHGVPLDELRGVVLPVDGLEAIRLVDALQMDHDEAAARMAVSRPTFSRLLAEARQIVATALINGWALRIEGGDFELADPGENGIAASCCGRGCRRQGVAGAADGHPECDQTTIIEIDDEDDES